MSEGIDADGGSHFADRGGEGRLFRYGRKAGQPAISWPERVRFVTWGHLGRWASTRSCAHSLGMRDPRSLVVLGLVVVSCTPEPKKSPKDAEPESKPDTETTMAAGSNTTPNPAGSDAQDATQDNPGANSPGSSTTGTTTLDPGNSPPALGINPLTPFVVSGRRLRAVYERGEDGSIHTSGLWYDLEIEEYCLPDMVDSENDNNPRVFCKPNMGRHLRCYHRYFLDDQCNQKAPYLADPSWGRLTERYFEISNNGEPPADCSEPEPGIYRITNFDPVPIRSFYTKRDDGTCEKDLFREKSHAVEIGERVPISEFAGGVIVVD